MAKSQRGKVSASKRGADKGVKVEETGAPAASAAKVASWVPVGLLVVSTAVALLAIYQWFELLEVQKGAKVACSINQTFDCASVWESGISKALHGATGVPVAGWGLVWGLAAVGASLLLMGAAKKNALTGASAAPLYILSAAGVLTSLGLFGVTMSIGVWCITCLGTYALVAAITGFTLKLPRPDGAGWMAGLARASVFVVAGYLVVLYPGLNTPVHGAPTGDLLGDFLIQLPSNVKQTVADALLAYRQGPQADTSRWPVRRLLGAPNAPVKIVEFSDIRCGHCRTMSETLDELERAAPPGSHSVELRQFPLDGACNRQLPKEMTDPTGARCAAAKALICMEPQSGFRRAQKSMFQVQEGLTKQRVLDIAVASGATLPELERCIDAPETQAKLDQDIEYAAAFHIEGTPLVIINGREAPGYPQFLYALLLANGNAMAQGWTVLPPGRPGQGAHAGHNHD
ncbi:thioredoxin domain-containing protein [Myxococcota bacterium]|nr:thioredoxin domain-containing protein [Myxococcota bacterium]